MNFLYPTINLARFVSLPFTARASLQADSLAATVLLALRLLDDIRHAAGCADAAPRLGIIGLADALAMLGTDYTAASGATAAAEVARLFASAALHASLQLARERGAATGALTAAEISQRFDGKLSRSETDAISAGGLRFGLLTCADFQPRLALLANNVADALSPLRGERQTYDIKGPQGERQVTGSGFALTLWRQLGARSGEHSFPYPTAVATTEADKARIAAAVQPWLDFAAPRQDQVQLCSAD